MYGWRGAQLDKRNRAQLVSDQFRALEATTQTLQASPIPPFVLAVLLSSVKMLWGRLGLGCREKTGPKAGAGLLRLPSPSPFTP